MKNTLLLLLLFIHFGYSQTTTVNYTTLNENISNPERGIYHHTETQSSNYSSLSVSQLENWRVNDNITLILRLFYLKDFINTPIPQSYLNNMQADFDKMRQAGVKCIVRFAYSNNTNGAYDANKAQMLTHINQVSPYLKNNSDVISVVQAGFIGVWGEWYYTDHFGIQPNNNDYNNRKEIVEALLDAVSTDRMVQLRTPKFKRTMYTTNALTENDSFDGTNISRIGHHNDCFLASPDDLGTYDNQNIEYPYLSQETNYTPMGGETCEQNLPRSGCTTAVDEMEQFHWSYLNADYHPNVMNDFSNGGCMETITNRLGYRLELKSGDFPVTVSNDLNIDITLYNKGFASLYNPRTAYIVLRNSSNNDEYRIALTTDPRTWLASSTEISLNETLLLPNTIIDGDYKLFLHLPDAEEVLSTRPEYAVRFANVSTWESNTGYNDLKTTITVNNDVLAMNDHEIKDFKIYPIPANDSVILKLDDINEYNISLYNTIGQQVNTTSVTESNNTLRLNTSNLDNGVYILLIENDTAKTSKKIVVNH